MKINKTFKNKFLFIFTFNLSSIIIFFSLSSFNNYNHHLIINNNVNNRYIKQKKLVNNNDSKMDINYLDKTLSTYYIKDFYSNSSLLTDLKTKILQNIYYFFPAFNEMNVTFNNIEINRLGDNDVYNFSDVNISGLDLKNINGQLYININLNTINPTTNVSTINSYGFILCGFKRNASCLFIDENNKNPGYIINNAISLNEVININNPNEQNIINFLVNNIFYYQNYNDPIKSNFTNISPNMIHINKSNKTFNIDLILPNKNRLFLNNKSINFINNLSFNNFSNENNWKLILFIGCTICGVILLIILISYLIVIFSRKRQIMVINNTNNNW